MDPKIPSITANPNTTISDSCNCCDDCVITCCFPRRFKKHQCEKSKIDNYSTFAKTDKVSLRNLKNIEDQK